MAQSTRTRRDRHHEKNGHPLPPATRLGISAEPEDAPAPVEILPPSLAATILRGLVARHAATLEEFALRSDELESTPTDAGAATWEIAWNRYGAAQAAFEEVCRALGIVVAALHGVEEVTTPLAVQTSTHLVVIRGFYNRQTGHFEAEDPDGAGAAGDVDVVPRASHAIV